MTRISPVQRSFKILHSSDLHIGASESESFTGLMDVLRLAHRESVSAILLAGDIFDNNRVPLRIVDRATALLGNAAIPVVVLPGNHDCLGPQSIYINSGIADPGNVDVLGVTADDSLNLANLDLQVWGKAHVDYLDMAPIAASKPRTARWHVAMAHGHWSSGPTRVGARAWSFGDDDIVAANADYIALGHWDIAVRVGPAESLAYYSGSPQIARTVNVVSFADGGEVKVVRTGLDVSD